MAKQMTITEAVARVTRHVAGVRSFKLDDNRERTSGLKQRAVKQTTPELATVISVAQQLLDMPLGTLTRHDHRNVLDVYTSFRREWVDTRF